MCDTDVLIGGFGLFGGRGEYMGKIKVKFMCPPSLSFTLHRLSSSLPDLSGLVLEIHTLQSLFHTTPSFAVVWLYQYFITYS